MFKLIVLGLLVGAIYYYGFHDVVVGCKHIVQGVVVAGDYILTEACQ